MRVLLGTFMVILSFFNELPMVNTMFYSVDGAQIRIEDISDDWDNDISVRVSVELDENIRSIVALMDRNGVYQVERSIDLGGKSSSYIWEFELGEQTSDYEGVRQWLINATDINGDSYNHYFQVKMDFTAPVINTDIFGDFGYEVLFDYRPNIRVWAEDNISGMDFVRINPSGCQNTYVDEQITPCVSDEGYEINYFYPNGEEYGYVITAMDCAGNISTRVIITRHNVTGRMKRIVPRGNYD